MAEESLGNVLKWMSGNNDGSWIHAFNQREKRVVPPAIMVNDVPDVLLYVAGEGIQVINYHGGQRKLCLGEVQFLTMYGGLSKYVVYAGAAPGNKTFYLHTLFPEHKFILVDPSKFELWINKKNASHRKVHHPDIVHLKNKYVCECHIEEMPASDYVKYIKSSKEKIFIIEDLMTNELAEYFKELSPLFISDIRTNSSDNQSEDTSPSNADVLWNMAMQYSWINIMKPVMSHLKHRLIYFDSQNIDSTIIMDYMVADFDIAKSLGIDFIKNFNDRKTEYFDGDIYLQCFARVKSTETRLVTDGKKTTFYDNDDFEARMYYFNTIYRSLVSHNNKYVKPEYGFDNCNDCALEAHIWEQYKIKSGSKKHVLDFVRDLNSLCKPLKLPFEYHGNFRSATTQYLIKFKDHKIAHPIQLKS